LNRAAAGRVATVSGAGGVTVNYQYEHPLGLLTGKGYNGIGLSYSYDDAGRIRGVSDGTRSLEYTSRTPGGLPLQAQYRTGAENPLTAAWTYDALWNVAVMQYARGAEVLDAIQAAHDRCGHRTSLAVAPTGESFSYGYDAAWRLTSEVRTLVARRPLGFGIAFAGFALDHRPASALMGALVVRCSVILGSSGRPAGGSGVRTPGTKDEGRFNPWQRRSASAWKRTTTSSWTSRPR
jgi:hypothetical protein